MEAYLIYLIVLGVISLITFFVYVADKVKAQNNAWRIPEKVLIILSLCGGAIGGYSAMFVARHKTKKPYFHLVNIIGLIWQIALFVVFCFYI